MWRAYKGVIYYVFDQIPNLQNCFITLNKNLGGDRGPQTDKHLQPSTFTSQFFKKSRHLGFGVFIDIWSMMLSLHVLRAHTTGISRKQREGFILQQQNLCACSQL